MIITHVNAYNAKQYTCTCQSSNQFNKQGISELLVYIKKEVVIPHTHPPFLQNTNLFIHKNIYILQVR